MGFYDWITQKYIDWRGNAFGRDKTLTEFSKWLEVPQPLLNQWMKPKGKIPTSKKYIRRLYEKFGVEVYQILGLQAPKPSIDMPEEEFTKFVQGWAERPAYYGDPMRQTAIWLPEEMIAWLKSQPGTMGETVRELIKQAMSI